MFTRMQKPLLVAALALVAVAGASGTATAVSFQAATTNIEAVSLGKISFRETFFARIECFVTLRGSLHSSISKVDGQLMGFITSTNVSECSGGRARAELDLPWHITYKAILGTLPNAVTGLRVVIRRTAFLWEIPSLATNCLYRGDVHVLIPMTNLGGETYRTGLMTIALTEQQSFITVNLTGGEACPRLTYTGSFSFRGPLLRRV